MKKLTAILLSSALVASLLHALALQAMRHLLLLQQPLLLPLRLLKPQPQQKPKLHKQGLPMEPMKVKVQEKVVLSK